MEFEDDTIRIEKSPNALDELVIDVTSIFEELDITYAVVSGYVAILMGRSRSTEDIDIIVQSLSQSTADELASRLQSAGYWGPAMPLDQLYETLADDLPVRIAEDEYTVPNVEIKTPTDDYDRRSLDRTITVELNDAAFRVGSIELQIAYKLHMGTERDLEDALHLYRVTDSMLNMEQLEAYTTDLGVEDKYEQLRRS